ncbi:hypothetical protein [Streptomyces sp. BA2]|uniref:hypothetical protein n=1 Tax=Streptomyces sp. BA2 TaxID=436595 RepID=UPI00132765A9|nr:hypothetical protein [Streptomyces sp. BA2]MWA07806.1 hypothetical protein [Streptomyces sp. BA2]
MRVRKAATGVTDALLVLIEPHAHQHRGPRQHTLAALAAARPGSLVIAPNGAADLATLRKAQARVITGSAGRSAARLLASARAASYVSAVAQRALSQRRWPSRLRRLPDQITLLARCLTEAACLRTARHLVRDPGAVVVLSASEALHGAAALLGGQAHLRFVHGRVATEDAALRILGRLTRRGERHVFALYPTAALRDQVAAAFPRLPGAVRTFAVDDGKRLTDAEREAGRAAFGIPDAATALCLIDGWGPYGDIDTVSGALKGVRQPLHLVVCGAPPQEEVLARWRGLPGWRVHAVPGSVGEYVLRFVYAAADAALVAQLPGADKEPRPIMDAVRLGVPLLVSEHDPDLSARLAGRPWAWLFPAGDPDALTAVLDRLAEGPPDRPGERAPIDLGMVTADEQADFLIQTYVQLLSRTRR